MPSSRTNSNLPVSRHFFKVMMPGFRKRLSIPVAFNRHIIAERSDEAVIRSPKGTWHVKIGKCSDGQLYFEEGWSDFVQEHDLNIGEFIVFEHTGKLHFKVLVYDYSCCEKEFPLTDLGNESDDKKRKDVHVHDTGKKRAKTDKSKIDSLNTMYTISRETDYF